MLENTNPKIKSQIAKTFTGHEADVNQILPFAAHLISVDENNVVKVWDIETTGIYLYY